MQIQTKQRILGALAILAILAIILPFVFRTSSFSLANHNKQDKQKRLNVINKQKVLQQPLTVDMIPKQPKEITNQPIASVASQQKQAKKTNMQSTPTTIVQNNQNTVSAPLSGAQKSQTDTTDKSHGGDQINPSSSKKLHSSEAPVSSMISGNGVGKQARAMSMKLQNKQSKNASVTGTVTPKYQSFALQLGSFSNKKNVDKLILKLQKMGFTAFYKPVTVNDNQLYRVYIGPELKKNRVVAWQKTLDRTLKIKSEVISYKATS